MKAAVGASLGLSLAVWVTFYLLTPDAPLTGPETSVVVGVCGGVVLFARWLWTRRRRTRDASANRG